MSKNFKQKRLPSLNVGKLPVNPLLDGVLTKKQEEINKVSDGPSKDGKPENTLAENKRTIFKIPKEKYTIDGFRPIDSIAKEQKHHAQLNEPNSKSNEDEEQRIEGDSVYYGSDSESDGVPPEIPQKINGEGENYNEPPQKAPKPDYLKQGAIIQQAIEVETLPSSDSKGVGFFLCTNAKDNVRIGYREEEEGELITFQSSYIENSSDSYQISVDSLITESKMVGDVWGKPKDKTFQIQASKIDKDVKIICSYKASATSPYKVALIDVDKFHNITTDKKSKYSYITFSHASAGKTRSIKSVTGYIPLNVIKSIDFISTAPEYRLVYMRDSDSSLEIMFKRKDGKLIDYFKDMDKRLGKIYFRLCITHFVNEFKPQKELERLDDIELAETQEVILFRMDPPPTKAKTIIKEKIVEKVVYKEKKDGIDLTLSDQNVLRINHFESFWSAVKSIFVIASSGGPDKTALQKRMGEIEDEKIVKGKIKNEQKIEIDNISEKTVFLRRIVMIEQARKDLLLKYVSDNKKKIGYMNEIIKKIGKGQDEALLYIFNTVLTKKQRETISSPSTSKGNIIPIAKSISTKGNIINDSGGIEKTELIRNYINLISVDDFVGATIGQARLVANLQEESCYVFSEARQAGNFNLSGGNIRLNDCEDLLTVLLGMKTLGVWSQNTEQKKFLSDMYVNRTKVTHNSDGLPNIMATSFSRSPFRAIDVNFLNDDEKDKIMKSYEYPSNSDPTPIMLENINENLIPLAYTWLIALGFQQPAQKNALKAVDEAGSKQLIERLKSSISDRANNNILLFSNIAFLAEFAKMGERNAKMTMQEFGNKLLERGDLNQYMAFSISMSIISLIFNVQIGLYKPITNNELVIKQQWGSKDFKSTIRFLEYQENNTTKYAYLYVKNDSNTYFTKTTENFVVKSNRATLNFDSGNNNSSSLLSVQVI